MMSASPSICSRRVPYWMMGTFTMSVSRRLFSSASCSACSGRSRSILVNGILAAVSRLATTLQLEHVVVEFRMMVRVMWCLSGIVVKCVQRVAQGLDREPAEGDVDILRGVHVGDVGLLHAADVTCAAGDVESRPVFLNVVLEAGRVD